VFHNLPPENCLQLLDRDLKRKQITAEALQNLDAAPYLEMLSLLEELSALPSWGNGRDIKTLAKNMIGMVYKAKPKAGAAITLSPEDTLSCIKTLLADRKARDASVSYSSPGRPLDNNLPRAPAPPAPISPAPPATRTRQATKQAPLKQKRLRKPVLPKQEAPPEATIERDPGVSDDVWNQLESDKAAEKRRLKRFQEELQKRQEEIEAMKAFEEAQKKLAEELAAKKAKDEAERQEFVRRQEEARLAEQRVRIAREKALAELERIRQQELMRERLEEQAQEKLARMGVCIAGYRWVKQAGGYRCFAGACFISNAQLGM